MQTLLEGALVAGTASGRRTFRADRVRAVEATGEKAERPVDFDLAASWRESIGRLDEVRLPFRAQALMAPGFSATARRVLGTPVEVTSTRSDGWDEVELRSYNPGVLSAQLAGLGAAVQVLGPDELLVELRRIAAELGALYLSQRGRDATA